MIEVIVKARETQARGICSFELVHPEGQPLPPFSAGAHIDVHLDAGMVRQYSLCNDPAEQHRYLIAVLLEEGGRGGSRAMHERVRAGDRLQISPPRNTFAMLEDAPRTVLLAGGIGVTPLLAMAERLAALGADFALHYSTRSRDCTAFAARLAAAPWAGRVHHHHDDGPQGRLDVRAMLATEPPGTHIYVCGPTGYIEHVVAEAGSAGLGESQIHVEYFGAVGPKEDDGSFRVELARSGMVVLVAPDQTIAEALEAAGVDVPLSCEAGVCGTCLTPLISGEPDHRDMFQTDAEHASNAHISLCCSRAHSPVLVIDM